MSSRDREHVVGVGGGVLMETLCLLEQGCSWKVWEEERLGMNWLCFIHTTGEDSEEFWFPCCFDEDRPLIYKDAKLFAEITHLHDRAIANAN